MNTKELNGELTDGELELVTAGGLLSDIGAGLKTGVTLCLLAMPVVGAAAAVGYTIAQDINSAGSAK
jgi:hypothetical protein